MSALIVSCRTIPGSIRDACRRGHISMCRSTVARETHAAIWLGQGIRLTVSQINSISVLRILLRQIPILTFNVWLSARSFVSPTRNIAGIKKPNRTELRRVLILWSSLLACLSPRLFHFRAVRRTAGGQSNGMSLFAVPAACWGAT